MMKKWLSRHWQSLALIIGFYIGLLLFVGGITVFGLEPKYVNYFSNHEFQIYKIQEKHYEFSIPYKISNAKIDRMTIDCASFALLVYLNSTSTNGDLILNIPRKLLDYKIGNQDDTFFVLTDGFEVEYQEIDTNQDSRTLWIPLEQSSKMIEIIASNVGMFPEPGHCGTADANDSPYYNLMPPLKQFKSGIPIDEIQCREDLELTLKSSNDSPVCVKPETRQKLIERGWATMVNVIPLAQPVDPRCMNLTTIKHNVNFDLKTPTYLPKDYAYLCGDGLENSNEARLLFGKAYLKNSPSLIGEVNKYIDEGAIFLYSDHAPRFSESESNSTEYILNTIREANERNPSLNLKQISINGHVGWANERCEVCGKQTANFANNTITSYSSTPSRIQFYDENNVVYFFQSNIPLKELIRVAESIK